MLTHGGSVAALSINGGHHGTAMREHADWIAGSRHQKISFNPN
jgi:hypothetical protein